MKDQTLGRYAVADKILMLEYCQVSKKHLTDCMLLSETLDGINKFPFQQWRITDVGEIYRATAGRINRHRDQSRLTLQPFDSPVNRQVLIAYCRQQILHNFVIR